MTLFETVTPPRHPIRRAVLARLRGMALKYDPSQSRDWRGRWVDELHDDAYDAAVSWASGEQRRLRSYQSGDPRRYVAAREVRALLTNVNAAPPTTASLYRGISLSEPSLTHLSALKPGDTIDLNLSSWTNSEAAAGAWAGNLHGQQSAEEVEAAVATSVLALEPGAHALDISAITNDIHSMGGYYKFSEWLTAGRFQVTDSKTEYGYGGQAHVRVGLRQVAALRTSDIKYLP